MRWWPEPTAGEIVWSHFHDNTQPNPRPGLVLTTKLDDLGRVFTNITYGTSKKTDHLYRREFRITKSEQPVTYIIAGLSYDTQFDLGHVIELPFNETCFSAPPHAPNGQTPTIGPLHASMVKILATAFMLQTSSFTRGLPR